MAEKVNLTEKLKLYFGFDAFKGEQEAIIRHFLAGNSALVLMFTGGGESLCYQLPSLIMKGMAIVVSPLIALMKNQADVINGTSEEEGAAHFLNSSLNKAAIQQAVDDVCSGRTELLYVVPESPNKEENIELLKTVKISFYVIDETHCISEWGHDFRPEYRNIRPTIDKVGDTPMIALTATTTDKVHTDIKRSLGIAGAREFKSSSNRPNLYYEVRQKASDIDRQIIMFTRQHESKSGIIYCPSRRKVEELSKMLKANSIKAAPYHVGLDSATRSQTQDDFLMERIDVIVATIAFGMDIGKPDMRFVIHCNILKSLEGHYQETGRAGRDGGEDICVAFYAWKDLKKLEKFMEGGPVAEQDIGHQPLQEAAAYAESSVCRRKMLLYYFSESYTQPNCHSCNNCLHPKERREGKDALLIILRAIVALKEEFRQDYVVDFVMGQSTEDIVSYKHDELEEFGSNENEDPKMRNLVIRRALIAGYIEKEVENYGVLKVTAAGKKFIKKPVSFMVALDTEFNDYDEAESSESGAGVLDPVLLSMLKNLRKQMSARLSLPKYIIFQDTSLEQMATDYPITLGELQQIQGVGAGKAKRYGPKFVELVKAHYEENHIERSEEMRIRTVAKESMLKIEIAQNIDLQVALDDIANALELDLDEMLDKLEAIVYSRTKINIDYFLEDAMGEDHVDEIYDYFLDSESDGLKLTMEELSDQYTKEELRLVRLRLISDLAN